MPSKSFYEIPLPREALDKIRDELGMPDNFIEDATGSLTNGPEPESAEVQTFLEAAQRAASQKSETVSADEARGGGSGN